tara:strand:+ start:733 stop:2550 length:1818 start_codon:yes stop_codon:yes gene_type:complete
MTGEVIEIEEMTTKNTSFSIDQLGKQCGKLQYVRELTQNSIEAILGDKGSGEIFWTFDREELKEIGIHKLSIIDNGPGMTGEDLRSLMNNMYSSGKKQSIDGNFGIGAKVAGLYRSPKGMLYKSYRDGKGVLGEFIRNSDGQYGLAQHEEKDGSWSSYIEIPYWDKPKQISEAGNVVTLIGRDDDEDTFTSPPEGEQGKEWLSRYLNGRYFMIPDGIELKVTYRNNPDQIAKPNYKRRTIKGMRHYLDKYQVSSGVVEVSGANMHWWVVDDSFRKLNYFTNMSHTGSLLQDEIYDLEAGNKKNRSRLNRCGIIHLVNKIVIYAEPTGVGVFADPSRTELLIEQGVKTPWLDWADEFFQNMPEQLAKLESDASERASDSDINIQAYDILKKLLKDFEIPKYSVKEEGNVEISPAVDSGGTPESGKTSETENQKSEEPKKRAGPRGRRYSDFTQDDGLSGREVPPSDFIPRVDWISPDEHPHLVDRAAQYIRTHNRLLINKEFRGYKHLIDDVFEDKGGGKPGARSTVEDICKLNWHIHLCETVLRVQMLKKGGKTWKQGAIDSALSEEALTASVSGIRHLNKAIKSSVGHAIGKTVKRRENELLVP